MKKYPTINKPSNYFNLEGLISSDDLISLIRLRNKLIVHELYNELAGISYLSTFDKIPAETKVEDHKYTKCYPCKIQRELAGFCYSVANLTDVFETEETKLIKKNKPSFVNTVKIKIIEKDNNIQFVFLKRNKEFQLSYSTYHKKIVANFNGKLVVGKSSILDEILKYSS